MPLSKTKNCWNTIGVWSENLPTCEKLREVIHCRNCNEYIRIGRDVFEKEIPENYISQWTREYAEHQLRKRSKTESVIIFRIANEWLGFPTKYFDEIVESKKIQRVPHYSGKVLLGIINVRGQIRLCFSLRKILGVTKEIDSNQVAGNAIQRNIVVQFEEDSYVFPVDEIQGVYRYEKQEMQAIPTAVNAGISESVDGILRLADKHVSCLNPYRIQGLIEASLNE